MADDLAQMVADGEPIPGVCNEDILLQGNSGSNAENRATAVRNEKAPHDKEKTKSVSRKGTYVPQYGTVSYDESSPPSNKKRCWSSSGKGI